MKDRQFYQPVSDLGDLARLEARWLRGATLTRRLAIAAAAFSALMIAINLTSTAFDPSLPTSQRAWSVFPVLAVAVALSPLFARDRSLRRRALGAQRRLLGHRGLLGRESEVRAAEGRLDELLAELAPQGTEARSALDRAQRESGRLLEELSDLGTQKPQAADSDDQRQASEQHLIVRLDGYLQVLETVVANAAIDGAFPASNAAREALERALAILSDGQPIEPTANRGEEARGFEYSVAVLPFADLSPEGDQEYFANGLAEELIGALTRVRRLRVIARSSSFSFQGDDSLPSEIGSRLNVDALIRGSVRKDGTQLRVTVQLIDTSDGRLLWSERYDGEMGDVFSIQDRLTLSVIEHLKADLRDDVQQDLGTGRTGDIDAYHFYLRGRHLWNKRTPSDLRDSLFYFEEAIERDPDYALAHAGMADSYVLLGYYSVLAPRESFPKARDAARRALELDDSLAEAHGSTAFVQLLYDWDWEGAEREFQRTLELSPGYATAHHWYAEYLTLAGRQSEALRHAATALELDPVSPIINVLVGWVHYYGRQYREAITALEAALRLDADFAPAHFWLGLAQEQIGEMAAAEGAFEHALAASDRSPMLLAAMARLRAEAGDTRQADALTDELAAAAESSYVPAYYLAAVYSGYGDEERTFEALEASLADREGWMTFLSVDPIWDPYRTNPRFRAMLEAVGRDRSSSD